VATCTNCGHSLLGLPGAPTETTGVFTADVRCPECGAAYRAGARILVGGSTAFAMTRARPLYQRALLSLVLGSGLATVVVHIMSVGALWFVISALIDLAAGGKRFISAHLIILWVLSLAAIYGVARFWWARRPALHDHTRSADERDRWLVIGPDGAQTHKECFEPWQIRTFRVHECLGAGDGRIVASIRPIPMRGVGWAKLSDEVHMAIPPGSAAALADALVGTVRGRHSLAHLELRESHGGTVSRAAIPPSVERKGPHRPKRLARHGARGVRREGRGAARGSAARSDPRLTLGFRDRVR